jgi:anti-repressor protein
MIQRTTEGKQIRQYFLDLEKAWNTPEQIMVRDLKMAGKTIDSLKDRCKFLGGQVVERQKLIEEMTPKANYVDHILELKSLVATTQIAKDYGMSAIWFMWRFVCCYKDELCRNP